MLLYYYPISKKHFEEDMETSTDNCIEASCDTETASNYHAIDCETVAQKVIDND